MTLDGIKPEARPLKISARPPKVEKQWLKLPKKEILIKKESTTLWNSQKKPVFGTAPGIN